ncbi:collagen alpha-1(I) chain-like [Mustela nigripes]|uniref:collagen alpha-1(I) chain-like n=1 Tax=Mustela nigripes TaxID=77151 RepID=UPI00281653DE|nr:collagen alpha-1(I) chain-like [Mustela nigripes]
MLSNGGLRWWAAPGAPAQLRRREIATWDQCACSVGGAGWSGAPGTSCTCSVAAREIAIGERCACSVAALRIATWERCACAAAGPDGPTPGPLRWPSFRRWERRARAQRRGPPRPPCARPADGRGPPLGSPGGLGEGLWAARARRAQLVDRTGGRPGTGCLGQCAGPEWRAGVLRRGRCPSVGPPSPPGLQGPGRRARGPSARARAGRAAVCRGGSERARADGRGRGDSAAPPPPPLSLPRACPARAPLVPRALFQVNETSAPGARPVSRRQDRRVQEAPGAPVGVRRAHGPQAGPRVGGRGGSV